jgi:hypothetical protein
VDASGGSLMSNTSSPLAKTPTRIGWNLASIACLSSPARGNHRWLQQCKQFAAAHNRSLPNLELGEEPLLNPSPDGPMGQAHKLCGFFHGQEFLICECH